MANSRTSSPATSSDAARILQRLGLEEAQALIDSVTARRRQSRSSQQAERHEAQSADRRIRSELAQMVREETDNGRAIVTFLVQAMQGELEDFKPCHRMSASRELLHRGFEYIPPDEDLEDDVVDKVEAARQYFAEERAAAGAMKKPSNSASMAQTTTVTAIRSSARARTAATTATATN